MAVFNLIIAALSCFSFSYGTYMPFDRVFLITMENLAYDQAVGLINTTITPPSLLMPFIYNVTQNYGVALNYFGVTHPSLPNYLAWFAGDTFNVTADDYSCYSPGVNQSTCLKLNQPNLADQLESKGLTWASYAQGLPSVGSLVNYTYGSAPSQMLYVTKHNPFVYFQDIATNSTRLQNIIPFNLTSFNASLQNPVTMPNFVYVVPDLCHDQHGTSIDCPFESDALFQAGDLFLNQTITTIMNSPSFTSKSVIFFVYDEDDFSGNVGSDAGADGGAFSGGGHILCAAITQRGGNFKSADPFNHYSLLATIQDGLGLPRLGNSVNAKPMWSLFFNNNLDQII